MITALDPEAVGLDHHVSIAESFRRLELVARYLDGEAIRVLHVDGIHEAAITLVKRDAVCSEPCRRFEERGARDIECDVINRPDFAWRRPSRVLPGFIRENGEQLPIAWIEVEMILFRVAEVRLLEDEWHSENALPEVDRTLFRRADDGDVMNSLYLDFLHGSLSSCTLTDSNVLAPIVRSPGKARSTDPDLCVSRSLP